MKLKTEEKKIRDISLGIVRKLVEMSNKHHRLILEKDWGNSKSLTIAVEDVTHAHVGCPTDEDISELKFLSDMLGSLDYMDTVADKAKK